MVYYCWQPMTELILIRHAQTQANVIGQWEGWSEGTLTPAGHAQAMAIAQRLSGERDRITALYSSPLRRALDTATRIGTVLQVQLEILEDLREINFGELNGITLEEMQSQHPALFARWKDRTDMDFQWPGGERRADFFYRASRACDHILSLHHDGGVVVVTHGGTLRACLAHLLPDLFVQWWGYALDNCSLTRVSVEKELTRLLVLNDQAASPE